MNVNFVNYHNDNPHVYELLLEYARETKQAGFKRYSIRAIQHRVRWHLNVETKDPAGFKINDHYSQDYAMKIMAEHPEFKDFFELRFPQKEEVPVKPAGFSLGLGG